MQSRCGRANTRRHAWGHAWGHAGALTLGGMQGGVHGGHACRQYAGGPAGEMHDGNAGDMTYCNAGGHAGVCFKNPAKVCNLWDRASNVCKMVDLQLCTSKCQLQFLLIEQHADACVCDTCLHASCTHTHEHDCLSITPMYRARCPSNTMDILTCLIYTAG